MRACEVCLCLSRFSAHPFTTRARTQCRHPPIPACSTLPPCSSLSLPFLLALHRVRLCLNCCDVPPSRCASAVQHTLAVRLLSLQQSLDTAIIAPVEAVFTLCHAKVDGELLDKLGGKVGGARTPTLVALQYTGCPLSQCHDTLPPITLPPTDPPTAGTARCLAAAPFLSFPSLMFQRIISSSVLCSTLCCTLGF